MPARRQQHVIARQAQHAGARHQEHGGEEQADKQAGARLLDAEIPEFSQKAHGSAQVGTGGAVQQVFVYDRKHG
jgi:hypothetical protein